MTTRLYQLEGGDRGKFTITRRSSGSRVGAIDSIPGGGFWVTFRGERWKINSFPEAENPDELLGKVLHPKFPKVAEKILEMK